MRKIHLLTCLRLSSHSLIFPSLFVLPSGKDSIHRVSQQLPPIDQGRLLEKARTVNAGVGGAPEQIREVQGHVQMSQDGLGYVLRSDEAKPTHVGTSSHSR